MSNMYDNFERRFTTEWFSVGWSDVEVKPKQETIIPKKDLATLQSELEQIQENIEIISQKQLRLSNLAKLYQN